MSRDSGKRARHYARLRERLARGLELVERGERYRAAARAGGFYDEYHFSLMCKRLMGARPRAVVGQDWRSRLEA